MIEDGQLSKACFYYEMFMEKAYGKYKPNIPGYHACIMKNLIVAEKGEIISVGTVAHYEEQLNEIKRSMEEAIDSYVSMFPVPEKFIDKLKEYKSRVVWAVCADELMDIVYNVIDLTASVPIEME